MLYIAVCHSSEYVVVDVNCHTITKTRQPYTFPSAREGMLCEL